MIDGTKHETLSVGKRICCSKERSKNRNTHKAGNALIRSMSAFGMSIVSTGPFADTVYLAFGWAHNNYPALVPPTNGRDDEAEGDNHIGN